MRAKTANSIYLDYNATAPLRPQVVARMQEVLPLPANPSSVHRFGREAKKQLEQARRAIAEAISAWPNEIIFTASGSEANALALHAFAGRSVLVSAVEHSSVRKAVERPVIIPVDGNGVVQLDALDRLLRAQPPPALVSVMLANNETGIIQPIQEISALCKKHDALFHCDAVQGLGKLPLDFTALGADMLTLAGHKCGGPVGAAALVARNNLPLTPLIKGGGQESGRRAGTENIAAIAGFAVAVEQAADLQAMRPLRHWLDNMERELAAHGAHIFSAAAPRLPSTSCLSMPGVGNEVQLIQFDLKGFAISAGSACSSGRIEPSAVLTAMGVEKEAAACAIRISGGWATMESDILSFSEAWKQIANPAIHQTHGRQNDVS